MKNKNFILFLILFRLFNSDIKSQTYYPWPPIVTDINGNTCSFGGLNVVDGYVNILQTTSSNIMNYIHIDNSCKEQYQSSNSVILNPGFHAGSFSGTGNNAGYFKAVIKKSDFDVVWIEPSATASTGDVGKYEKLEMGINLPQYYNDAINNYLTNNNFTTNTNLAQINPFNGDPSIIERNDNGTSDYIALTATFTSPSNVVTSRDAFWYRNYQRSYTDLNGDNLTTFTYNNETLPYGHWKEITTPYNWRIRFAPDELGIWTVNITVTSAQFPTQLQVNNLYFNCIASSNPGYLEIGQNNYLRFHETQQSFFPIGENLSTSGNADGVILNSYPNPSPADDLIPEKMDDPSLYYNPNSNVYEYRYNLQQWINESTQNGANMFTFELCPYNFDYEWEQLLNYDSPISRPNNDINDQITDSRLARAWELDNLFEWAATKNYYIDMRMMLHNVFNIIPISTQWQCNYYGWNKGFDFWLSPNEPWARHINPLDYPPANPYNNSSLLGVNSPADFFFIPAAFQYYKQKLRYFFSRWGYSSHLAYITLLTEMDNVSTYFEETYQLGTDFSSAGRNTLQTWLTNVSDYINGLGFSHLIKSASTADPNNFINIPEFNITMLHDYNNLKFTDVWRYNNTQSFIQHFNKPFIIDEMGSASTYIDKSFDGHAFHNALWSTAFSGALGSGFNYWWEFRHWGGLYSEFKGLSNFFQNIDFESEQYSPPDDHLQTSGNAPWDVAATGITLNCATTCPANITTSPFGSPDPNNSNNNVLNFELVNATQTHAMGWIHNTTDNWYNWSLISGSDIYDICNACNVWPPCDADAGLISQPTNLVIISGLTEVTYYRYKLYNSIDCSLIYENDKLTDGSGNLILDLANLPYYSGGPILNSQRFDLVYKVYSGNNHFRFAENLPKDSLHDNTGLEIYPNPNNGNFILKFNQQTNEPKNIFVFDAIGRKLFSKNNFYENNLALDLSQYSKGVYQVQVISKSQSITKKIVIE